MIVISSKINPSGIGLINNFSTSWILQRSHLFLIEGTLRSDLGVSGAGLGVGVERLGLAISSPAKNVQANTSDWAKSQCNSTYPSTAEHSHKIVYLQDRCLFIGP